MKLARYNYRFYPTKEQEQTLACTFGCARVVYNHCVNEFRKEGKMPDMSKQLTQRKKEDTWLGEVSSVVLQQAIRHFDTAKKRFFKKLGGRPKHKRRSDRQSVTYTSNAFIIRDGEVKLAKMQGCLDVRWSRKLPSEPTSCVVSRDTVGRYFISFAVSVDPKPLPPSTNSVGIDVGITHFAVLSNGEKIESPSFLKKDLDRLARAQQSLARKKRGSENRKKAKRRVACIHAHIAAKRKDFLHKLSTRLVRDNQAIAIEDLDVKGMMQHRGLSRSISDAGWGMFREMLKYKCDWYGRTLKIVDRWFPSSKTCSGCKFVADELPLNVREWTCEYCLDSHDRDVNAAINIKMAEGHSVHNVYGEDASVFRHKQTC